MSPGGTVVSKLAGSVAAGVLLPIDACVERRADVVVGRVEVVVERADVVVGRADIVVGKALIVSGPTTSVEDPAELPTAVVESSAPGEVQQER